MEKAQQVTKFVMNNAHLLNVDLSKLEQKARAALDLHKLEQEANEKNQKAKMEENKRRLEQSRRMDYLTRTLRESERPKLESVQGAFNAEHLAFLHSYNASVAADNAKRLSDAEQLTARLPHIRKHLKKFVTGVISSRKAEYDANKVSSSVCVCVWCVMCPFVS